jgi:nucleotide-binding universal stress UspA family protein
VSIRTILASVSGAETDSATLATAFALAGRHGAHVDVLFARPTPAETVPMVGEGVSSALVEQLLATAGSEWAKREMAARRAFDAAVAATGLLLHDTAPGPGGASASWRPEAGREDRVVRRACPVSDLVVMANHTGSDDNLQFVMTLEAALLTGGRPLLLIPVGAPRRAFPSIAIAWDNSGLAARAVAGAMPLLRDAVAVTVLSAATPRTDPARAAELAGYLAWHGIAATADRIDPGHGKVAAALLARAGALGADLLVMGGYGHSRMREFILGGVTRHVLTHTAMPVLMAH